MDSSLAYDMSRYDFTEETWGEIFAFESRLKSHKQFKKVNFKEGEKETYISWVKSIIHSPEYEMILFKNRLMYNPKVHKSNMALDEKRIHHKLEMIFSKNKYWLQKVNTWGMKFSFEDVCEFLQLLNRAVEYDCLENFLSIPDVWYITRNIRKNWSVIKNIANIY